MDKKETAVRPVFKKMLILAIAIYVIGMCMIQADIYHKIGCIEHSMVHGGKACPIGKI